MSELRIRDAVRALVIDTAGRVLLVRFELPSWTGWATPGGGVVRGESDDEALRRELVEETGLVAFERGPLVWTRLHLFDLGEWHGQRERYYLVRTEPFVPAPALTWEQLNGEYVTDVRWWGLADLEELGAAGTQFAPRRLPVLLRELLLHGPPAEPVDVGV